MKNKIIPVSLILFFSSCFKSSEELAAPSLEKPKMMLFCNLEGSQPVFDMFLTRTNKIGTPIKWNFNRGDTLDFIPGMPSSLILNSSIFWDTVKNPLVQFFEDDSLLLSGVQSNRYIRGTYATSIPKAFEENKTYTIKVSAPGFDTISASQKMPASVPLKKLTFTKGTAIGKNNERLSEISLEFTDPPGIGNAYLVSAVLYDTARFTNEVSAQLYRLDGRAINNNLITDESFDGQNYTWRVGTTIGLDTRVDARFNRFFLTFRTVSADYRAFAEGVENTNRAIGNPFVEPFNLYTNVKNGYGLFNLTGRSTVVEIKFK